MPLFNGQLTSIVQAGEEVGELVFEAQAKGLTSAKMTIKVN